MYLLYRSRHLFSWLPALIVVGCVLFASQQAALKIQPRYDETTMELALVEPDPEPQLAPPVETPPQPEPPPPEPEAIPEPVVPAPEPIIEAKPVPKPKPKPKPVKEKAKPMEKAKPVAAPSAPRALVSKPATQPTPAAPSAPKVNTQAIENGYLQALRRELEQRKRYPSGRQASLERPQGNVEVWLEVDRSGRVLSSGIANKATSMLLNRAALSSLQSISQVRPFPSEAFNGQTTKRFSATFNYQAP
ncbi:transport protein TonB [Serratia proteamaculans]|uniref:Energy transducer TonB n=1 Tax=Serratia proteamaculans TaxID=28151 RepID=A0ABS0TP14_SERPR|nr:energy transducer TonB [Serratia proteamaculans]KAB1495859.1 energy transducer TonB [Serratia proteamaculans]MBI6180081.1 energy transducer TonB [Serratia proteamaculans]RYM53819.1 energy transducer TonB [Serratia proteamaculans]CAI1000571.1 transport protein TonB [Serratia proteamaculans]CAI1003989.1 transport protein TonB [Serratia proteamaculans]